MAKTKKNSDPAGGIFLLFASFLGAIILLASFLAVLVLIGVWVHFERAAKRYPGITGPEDIRLSPDDKLHLADYQRTRKRIQQRLAEIDNRKHHLLVRQDGSFDGRSKEGRALNTELETLRSDLSSCNVAIFRLESWERLTYRDWVTNKSGLFASRIAVCSLPISITAFFFYQPTLLLALSALIERQAGLHHPEQLAGFYGAISFGAWSSIILFMLLWGLSAMAAPKLKSEKHFG